MMIKPTDRTISAKVGENGVNRYDDVVTIQELLNEIDPRSGGAKPKLKVDGKCGPRTKEAIQKFQLEHFGWKLADARVDPYPGPTLQRMNECAGGLASWKKNTLFAIRRQLPDDFESRPGLVDVFEVHDKANRRRASYALVPSEQTVLPPAMILGLEFKGKWTGLRASAPLAIHEMGGPATLKTEGKEGPLPTSSTALQVRTKSGPLLSGLVGFSCNTGKQGYFKFVSLLGPSA